MNKISLPNVTLVAMTSVRIWETIRALKYSMRGITYGEVILISHERPWYLPKSIQYKYTTKLENIDDFNYKMVYELKDYISTEYALIVHHDGFVIHPEKWSANFLNYDYIGAPWPEVRKVSYLDSKGNVCRVGNSVSIRSRRLLEYPSKRHLKWEPMDDGYYNEDTFLCCKHKNEMEEEGLRWAPVEVAACFSQEMVVPENKGIVSFAFHKWWGGNEKNYFYINPVRYYLRKIKKLVVK